MPKEETTRLEKARNRLAITSWILLGLSFLIDTSHHYSFPAYNIVIALWACACGYYKRTLLDKARSKDGTYACATKAGVHQNESILTDVSSFISIGVASLVFDMIFCSAWGPEVLRGDEQAIRFSFTVFIVNMPVKVVALIFAAQIILSESTSKDNLMSRRSLEEGGEESSTSDCCFEDVEDDVILEEGRNDLDDDTSGVCARLVEVASSPLPPPITPGVPGLISPAAIKRIRKIEGQGLDLR